MTNQPQPTDTDQAVCLHHLPLHDLHVSLEGKMVPFAGYEMPVQYPMGVMKEHLHVREKAGLFDVSHMGQAWLSLKQGVGEEGAHEKIAAAIETIVPGEIQKLGAGRVRYSVLLNDAGGVLDDLMITRPSSPNQQGRLFLVVNAAMKQADFLYLAERLGDVADLTILSDRALLALQGPLAAAVLEEKIKTVSTMGFMTMRDMEWAQTSLIVSRCGYTGEDGYELSVSADRADAIARALLADERVQPIGLGARDSLRLEAGLCLYGHDMTADNSPVEANISFAIGKRRRSEGGFAGAERILRELAQGPKILRVGLRPDGRAPAREGTEIQSLDGETIGTITSGGFGPTIGGPIAMGYVDANYAESGTKLNLIVRGKPVPARVCPMPFVPQRYYRAPK